MRSPARLVNGTAAAALAVAALGLSTAASPAYAGDLGALEISPATAAPGTTVVVNTAACGSGARAVGDANSLEAGQFTLAPATGKQVLVGTFKVPEAADAGPYSIGVSCENGKEATGALAVRAADTGQAGGQATEKVGGQDDAPGDDRGGGGKIPSLDSLLTGNGDLFGNESPLDALSTDDTILGRQSSPEDDSPTGRDSGSGSGRENGNGSGRDNGNGNGNGNGRDNGNGSGRDNGNESGRDNGNGNGNGNGRDNGNGSGRDNGGNDDGGRDNGGDEGGRDNGGDGSDSPLEPSGHVKTGVGGSVRPDTTQIAAGAGVLAVSAVGGAWLLRRRASGTQAGN
ncbi:hypothetical protein [Streptomyces sp. NBC_00316]|uniref:hypothetical protein n=1 Tax=Streptomyces sp. NBC_00316 TaxID=2975710 RepID=UPI002E2C0BE8|nr:hypothetical protein [Streptomyces sp. NBC_00316]